MIAISKHVMQAAETTRRFAVQNTESGCVIVAHLVICK
jgi:hypothetical protein